MLNRIQLIGRLTRDPELRYVSNGHPLGVHRIRGGHNRSSFKRLYCKNLSAASIVEDPCGQQLSKVFCVAFFLTYVTQYATRESRTLPVPGVGGRKMEAIDGKANIRSGYYRTW